MRHGSQTRRAPRAPRFQQRAQNGEGKNFVTGLSKLIEPAPALAHCGCRRNAECLEDMLQAVQPRIGLALVLLFSRTMTLM